MSIFKEASRIALRFQTPAGLISAEQLWKLSLPMLDELAIALNEKLEKTSKTFLKKVSEKDKITKLQFDIILEIMQTIQSDNEAEAERVKIKMENSRIDEIIAKKESESLESLSLEDLRKLKR